MSYFLPGEGDNADDSEAFAIADWIEGGTSPGISSPRFAAENPGKSFVVARHDRQWAYIKLPALHEAIKTFRRALKRARDQYFSGVGAWEIDKNTSQIHIPRLISELRGAMTPDARHPLSGANSSELNNLILDIEQKLVDLGKAALPPELLKLIPKDSEIVIVPDGRMFMLPLHVMPYSDDGRTLLHDNVRVRYKTRSDYGSRLGSHEPSSALYACVNTSDDEFTKAGGMSEIGRLLGADNSWLRLEGPGGMLKRMSAARLSVIMAHGHSNQRHEMASRIALRDGYCLSTLDVAQSRLNFSRCGVFLFSCHSMPQRASIGRELLGPAGAFLTKGVGCVGASIWKCQVDDAAIIARWLIERRPALSETSDIWNKALSEICNRSVSPLDRFVRLGCFVLYTSL